MNIGKQTVCALLGSSGLRGVAVSWSRGKASGRAVPKRWRLCRIAGPGGELCAVVTWRWCAADAGIAFTEVDVTTTRPRSSTSPKSSVTPRSQSLSKETHGS